MKRILSTLSQKWTEYLLEILVLIIGIYGAFALEEWGDKIDEEQKEQVILNQLLEDFEANKLQLEAKIEMRKTIIQSGLTILNELDQPTSISTDSLLTCISIITLDPTFDPINNDLVISGNIELISNPALTKMLANWTSDILAVKEIEYIWQTMSYEELAPFLIKAGITRSIVNKFWKNTNQQWLLDQSKRYNRSILNDSKQPALVTADMQTLEGFASMAISLNLAANEQSSILLNRIDNIIELIEKELGE
jgi:hypothetical protein